MKSSGQERAFHDYAIQFGRDLKCVRIPLPEAELKTMADYLNSRNQMYAEAADKNFRIPLEHAL